MSTQNEQMYNLAKQYKKENDVDDIDLDKVAEWALNNKYWEPRKRFFYRQFKEEMRRALRNKYLTDPQGRRVRVMHVLKKDENGTQLYLWKDIETASHEHMHLSFQQRRKQIVGDCNQLKTDVDSYNENFNESLPIQLVFDFTNDLKEIEIVKQIDSKTDRKRKSHNSNIKINKNELNSNLVRL